MAMVDDHWHLAAGLQNVVAITSPRCGDTRSRFMHAGASMHDPIPLIELHPVGVMCVGYGLGASSHSCA